MPPHRPTEGGIAARLHAAMIDRGPAPESGAAQRLARRSRKPVDGAASAPALSLFESFPASATSHAGSAVAASGASVSGASRPRLANGGVPFTPPLSSEAQKGTATPAAEPKRDGKTPPTPPTARRRWDLLAGISRMLRVGLAADERGPSVCGCGRPGYDIEEVGAHRRGASTDRPARAYVSGVYRCGSGWLCPTCAPAVATIRQARVQRVVEATTERGGSFVMGLVTVSHGPTDRLADLKRLVTESFAAARRGAPWERIRRRGGVAGVMVAPEVTHGTHGWHFHAHFGMPCLANTEAARGGRGLGRAVHARRGGSWRRRARQATRAGRPGGPRGTSPRPRSPTPTTSPPTASGASSRP